MQYALEVCVDSFKSAVAAADSGADRLELASCLDADLDFTFHRAFDVVKDQRTALNSLIDCGVKRILTSGGHSKAFHGLEELSALIQHAEGRVSIMPGGGVDEDNAATILQVTGAKEIHGSFSCPQPSKMQFLHPKVHFSSKKTSFLHRRAGIMHAQSTIHVPEGEEGEERNEYSQEELAEFWGRRVASEEKIKIVKAALEALNSTADVERQMD
ncbi:putative Copper homeostasis protein CutC [Nannochloris sp. 'desiccata']|nr:putative Copper homeostasis protein CutC [Chlorella desiccata (nom. nud.)]